ncbi:hypothetical protein M0802_010132 [Mischocyttarus mexicanus]|nr:hypothetical protein M0802_010132 [Mischocyttarus mexicanus]
MLMGKGKRKTLAHAHYLSLSLVVVAHLAKVDDVLLLSAGCYLLLAFGSLSFSIKRYMHYGFNSTPMKAGGIVIHINV